MLINNKTHLNVVIGNPLDHSQSPLLHNMVYNVLNINAVLLAISSPNLKSLIQGIKNFPIELIAVTMPFKKDILQYLDHYNSEIKTLEAVNTIIHREGKLYGYNTDIDGISYALRNISILNKCVLIIGAGGAARVVASYMQKNHANLVWINRTHKNALYLSRIFGGEVVKLEHINNISIDIIVNTTPIGMFPYIHNSPLPNYQFNKQQIIFDMVYNPIHTRLLKQAGLSGAKIIPGLDLFIRQGLSQIELWTNKLFHTDTLINHLKNNLINNQSMRE